MSEPLTEHQQGVLLAVRVTPKASRNEIAGIRDGRLLVKVTAAPEDGKANQAVIKLLAKAWRIPASSFEVLQGATSRTKTLLIRDRGMQDIPLAEPPAGL